MQTPLVFTRRNPEKKRRPSKITIPKGVCPAVTLVFTEMHRQSVTYQTLEDASSVLRSTIKAWRHRNNPSLVNLTAVFSVLGWDLVPVPREKALPADLAAELRPIADRFGLTMPATVAALIEHVAQGRQAPPTAASIDDMAA